MNFNKKSQFLVISVMILLALSIVIYSQETVNTYKSSSLEYIIHQDVEFEVCQMVRSLNGTQLEESISTIESGVEDVCLLRTHNCSLMIQNMTEIPVNGNWSEHNYTHYYYEYSFESSTANHLRNLSC